ncbi:MAG: type II toxin-antitoxin system RelE/ParE family toxin [Nitrospirae bacterium]|nr:type II toxin-antitoxin system RelE/ParE family toxin [Nitrospirota bacterium]MCL5976507.1 type II toxin-antitoxin system RelE/ParE family toxin [Nitrospirota bacterium]
MKPVVFLPEAEQEMLEAAIYYESKSSGLGIDYLAEVERATKSVSDSPNTWSVVAGELRRRLVRRFPFGILYRIEPEEIVIIAVAHLRRKPGYWKERIKS